MADLLTFIALNNIIILNVLNGGDKMKILCIGNSFSMDATRYLYGVGKSCGIGIKTVNLYIGGCSLYTHYINAVDDRSSYELDFNGFSTGFNISIKQGLTSDDFDIVTLQQASHFSFKEESYQPYLSYLAGYIKKYCPHAKIFIHQTWAYNPDEKRLEEMGFSSHREMYTAIEKTYEGFLGSIDACGLIPSGKTICNLVESGMSSEKIFRDPIHASLGIGRYALALAWLEYLTGLPAEKCSFSDFDVPVSSEDAERVAEAAHIACEWAKKYKK